MPSRQRRERRPFSLPLAPMSSLLATTLKAKQCWICWPALAADASCQRVRARNSQVPSQKSSRPCAVSTLLVINQQSSNPTGVFAPSKSVLSSRSCRYAAAVATTHRVKLAPTNPSDADDSSHQDSAVDLQHFACNIASFLGGKEPYRMRHFHIGSGAAQRHCCPHLLLQFFRQHRRHRRFDEPRSHGIHRDIP